MEMERQMTKSSRFKGVLAKSRASDVGFSINNIGTGSYLTRMAWKVRKVETTVPKYAPEHVHPPCPYIIIIYIYYILSRVVRSGWSGLKGLQTQFAKVNWPRNIGAYRDKDVIRKRVRLGAKCPDIPRNAPIFIRGL
jgi:hypothetical protein